MEQTYTVPRCMGLILDGNRRWAKERGLPSMEGHRRGYEKMKEAATWAKERGIKNVIVYGFSTENWNRAPEEVVYLMDIFRKILREDIPFFKQHGIRITIIGTRERFDADMQKGLSGVEEATKECDGMHLVLALSYGGRSEITDAVNRLIKKGKPVTEEDIGNALWSAGIPDPDIVVRTGGAERLSNFLPWQSVYSELLFMKKYWPDFTAEDIDFVIKEFNERERRFGK